ncbi:hypothetical protein OUZ56_026460 [Daphnia magna]|uniref:Ankyrin repeat domain-containing protein n=1 Tax=Daphnia magna TaxID=35525 RepID=A0ABQ9ZLX6_9CRUS|nr:hypothetical protein OUZ56_026460 [Daphnia magna]
MQREENFKYYGYLAPTFKLNPNTTPSKCSNCAMKTYPTFSAAKADAVLKRGYAITRLCNQEIFLEMIDAPRKEIRKGIIKKLGSAAWDYCPKAEFLNQRYDEKTLLHRMDPKIEEDGQTIAHKGAAENNKLLIRILRFHQHKFAAHNSLGETPLVVAIAYGNEDVANYLWISGKVVQMVKDNNTVLHYAAKYGNDGLARAACKKGCPIDIN